MRAYLFNFAVVRIGWAYGWQTPAAQHKCSVVTTDSEHDEQARSREMHADLLHALIAERAVWEVVPLSGAELASERYAGRANPTAPFLHSSFSYSSVTVLSRQRKSLMMLVLCTQDLVAYDTGQLPHAANARAAPPAIVSSITWGRR